jgi:hypothetical protein
MNTKPDISRSPNSRIFTSRITVIALAAFALLMLTAASAFMAPPLPGAIFTTDAGCSGTNINIFPSKDAVWLDGGPAHPGAAGLAEGNYYVKVTEPDGTLLGSSIGGPLGPTPVHVNSLGEFDTCYRLVDIVSPVPGGGGGYNDTTNGGDEYKAWVCTDAEFVQCKTDNFKVKSVECQPGDPGCELQGGLEVRKFYDADMDGEKDPGEAYLEGWKFDLSPAIGSNPLSTTFSSAAAPGIYTATERDTIETNWFASTPKTLSTVVVQNAFSVIEFGNYCELTPGGHTIGFWSNKNGQNLEDAADFTELTGLCLRNADGSDKDFTGTLIVNKKSLNIWLLDAKAVNMAYMLSAQLAATELSVNHGFTNPNVIVDGLDNVTALMAHANALLCADGYTPGGDPNRAEQARVKDILDKINNGGSFVQPNADNCPYTFLP